MRAFGNCRRGWAKVRNDTPTGRVLGANRGLLGDCVMLRMIWLSADMYSILRVCSALIMNEPG